jgi:thiol-disulfide isomerase/thioredoxin
MTKIIALCIAILITSCLFGQSCTINGNIGEGNFKKITLFKVLNGRLSEIATSVPNSDGNFGFRFVPNKEGIYVIGTRGASNLDALLRFYFRGNDELNLKLNATGYELIGKNTRENLALYSWDLYTKDILQKSLSLSTNSTYVDFFPQIDEMSNKLLQYKKNPKTGNVNFDRLFPKLVDNDFAFYALNFLYMPHAAQPSEDEMSNYYTEFNPAEYLTDQLLNLPYGDRFMNILIFKKVNMVKRPTFEQIIEAIPLEVLRGQYVLNRMESLSSYLDFEILNEKYNKYFTLPEQKFRAEIVESKLVETKTGVKAFNFNFSDIQGKNISLADLKGKIVLVDMWATWCGPCRAEEPYWEKLNEEFTGREIAFVGISVDKDKKVWENYVREKGSKGIQLHAGLNDPLSAAYKIAGIPRYILIDKQGNLITPDCPRPSDIKLKSLLEDWLKK